QARTHSGTLEFCYYLKTFFPGFRCEARNILSGSCGHQIVELFEGRPSSLIRIKRGNRRFHAVEKIDRFGYLFAGLEILIEPKCRWDSDRRQNANEGNYHH